MLSSYCIPTFTWIHAFQTGVRHSHSVGGGEGLNNQHEVGGEGGRGGINDDDDEQKGGCSTGKYWGKGWQGDDKGDNYGRVSHLSFLSSSRMLCLTQWSFRMGCGFATPTVIAELSLYCKEVCGEGKTEFRIVVYIRVARCRINVHHDCFCLQANLVLMSCLKSWFSGRLPNQPHLQNSNLGEF